MKIYKEGDKEDAAVFMFIIISEKPINDQTIEDFTKNKYTRS